MQESYKLAKKMQEFYKLAKNDARVLQIGQKLSKGLEKHREFYQFYKVPFAGFSCRQIDAKSPASDPGVLTKLCELLGDCYKKV
jgi:hypothetical protein